MVEKELGKSLIFESDNNKLRKARSPLHILIIDDEPVTCRLIKHVFSEKYCVRTCSNLQEGLNEYLSMLPDLVFLDINLGDNDFNGIDVLKAIKERDANANVVIITSSGSKEYILDSWNNGAIGFLKKPFGTAKLLEYANTCELKKLSMSDSAWN